MRIPSCWLIVSLIVLLCYCLMSLNNTHLPTTYTRSCSNHFKFDPYYPMRSLGESSWGVASEPRNATDLNVTVSDWDICPVNSSTDILFIVHSHANNSDNRCRMRYKYFTEDFLLQHSAKVLFVVGETKEQTVNSQILKEADQYGDIHQVKVPEDYHSITYKARSWLSHVNASCSDRIRYIVKIDDDILMDPQAVCALLAKFGTQTRFVACRTFSNGVVVRNPNSKWHLSREEYAFNSLGLYCQGMAYMFSGDLVPIMAANIDKVQYLWMDDWYVTHALLNGTNAMFADIGQHYLSINSQRELDALITRNKIPTLLFAHFRPPKRFDQQHRQQIWDHLRKRSCDDPSHTATPP